MPRPHGAASSQQQVVSVSTHLYFCAEVNVAASVRQIWWHSNSC